MGIKEFFKPTTLKVIISIFLFIIIFSLIQIFFHYWNFPILIIFIFELLISLILGYLIGSCIDYFIKSNTIKIIIAVILAIFALLASWTAFSYTFRTVCDPVHEPSPVVCDPVHQP